MTRLEKLKDIIKVVSGSNGFNDWIDHFYGSFIKEGTYKVSSIKVAEAAKVIENTQRDINIALMNELAIICNLLDIDTAEVIDAASSKWNFLPFKPGLVGGLHCVDPYYLTYKAESMGYHPQVVLAGRRINDSIPCWIANNIIIEMAKRNFQISSSRVLVLGLTFKENCPDLRNTKVLPMIKELQKCNILVDAYEPYIINNMITNDIVIEIFTELPKNTSI